MSWDEISDSLKASLYDRGKSPFYGSFIISWLGWNWRLVFSLFGDGKQDFVTRITIINEQYVSLLNNLIFPLGTAVLVFVLGNFLTSIFLRIKFLFSNYRRNKIQKLDLLDDIQTAKAWEKINKKEVELNKMLVNKNTEIDTYKSYNSELTNKITEVKQKNIELEQKKLDFEKLKNELVEKENIINTQKQQKDLNVEAIQKLEKEINSLNEKIINNSKNSEKLEAKLEQNNIEIKGYTEQLAIEKTTINKLEKEFEKSRLFNPRLYIHSGWQHRDIKEHYVVSTNTIFNARIILNEIGQTCTIYIGLQVDKVRYWIGFSAGKKISSGVTRNEYNSTKVYETKEIIIQEYIMSIFFEAYPKVDPKASIVVDCVRLRGEDKNKADIIFNYSFK